MTAFAVYAARQIAIAKQRSATGWMWAAAVFPPAVIPLTLLPKRATHSEVTS